MLLCRASLPLSRQTLAYATGVLRRHRKEIGSKGRALPLALQVLVTLAQLRKGETFAELGAGFAVSTTAWRYVNEAIDALVTRSPQLGAASDRPGCADRPYYSGTHHRHGMNFQVTAAPDGGLL